MSKTKIVAASASQGSVHLDALRGAAALLVFVNHTRALYFSSVLEPAPNVHQEDGNQGYGQVRTGRFDTEAGQVKISAEAVVIFFVLSGYLVGGSVLKAFQRETWSWTVYLTKRLTRLYVVLIPAVFLGVALDMIGSRIFGPGSVYTAPAGLDLVLSNRLAAQLQPSVIVGNLLFLQGILTSGVGTNASLWSLSNEFWYYMAFPCAVSVFASKSAIHSRIVYGLIAVAIVAFVGPKIAVLFPIWIMGALIALIPRRFRPNQAQAVSRILAVLLLVAMIAVRILPIRALVGQYIVGAMTAILIYAIIQQVDAAREGLYKAVAGFFSRTSYSLYLFHLPLAVFLCGLFNSPWHMWTKTPIHWAEFFLIDLATLGATYALWLVFESNTDPIRTRVFERENRGIPSV